MKRRTIIIVWLAVLAAVPLGWAANYFVTEYRIRRHVRALAEAGPPMRFGMTPKERKHIEALIGFGPRALPLIAKEMQEKFPDLLAEPFVLIVEGEDDIDHASGPLSIGQNRPDIDLDQIERRLRKQPLEVRRAYARSRALN